MASPIYLHRHREFPDLLRIVAKEIAINDPTLVEKDYWIMHCLYGLQQMGLQFQLKGGTSLSKAYKIIHRFSEDIDIRIEPLEGMTVEVNPKKTKKQHCESREKFYDELARRIEIDGIQEVSRDREFDDELLRSGGIKLHYAATTNLVAGVKDGILLEVGFDDVAPNRPLDISSWAYDYAADKVALIDNRAKGVLCYHPGYTLVEKLQTVSTKYRQQQDAEIFPKNFLRHYYDIFCLLENEEVRNFIGTDEYKAHKEKRFRRDDNRDLTQNEAFLLHKSETRDLYEAKYQETSAIYYQGQVSFDRILNRIQDYASKL